MAGNRTIRTLVTKLVADTRQAVKDLKLYDVAWKALDKSVEAAANNIERNAARAVSALSGLQAGAGAVAAAARAGGGGGGSRGPRPARTSNPEIDRIVREGQREAARPQREQARRERSSGVAEARRAGLAAGGARVDDAARGLGVLATASDRAKAKVADLTATVERNRKEMVALREQVVRTGDADGTLAARMQGLAVATGKAQGELREARAELRKVDGGLIDAIKSAAGLAGKFDVLKVAAGNLLAGGISRGIDLVRDGLVGSAKAAMEFEKGLVDISKVARGADDTAAGMERIEKGIKAASRELGVMPGQVADLTAQLAPVFSGKIEDGAAVDLVALTEQVTKIGVAWDVTGKEAGKFFADASRGLGTTTKETASLFGSINELSNQIGVKAADVADAVTRSAGVIKASGLSGETGAALNATLIAAGASSDVAATGVRTFVARLGAGSAATKKQVEAFTALGLKAEDVAAQLVQGGTTAEKAIKDVVVRIGELRAEDRLPVLIELFGSESIGSIGAAATAVDTLGEAFRIAGDKTAVANSVQKEYDRVSNTTAARVEKLKANVGVLAVEFGEALLPHIDRVVEFLTSPEGQEWGRDAVAKATDAVTTLASAVGVVASSLGSLIDLLGGTGTAVAALGVTVAALAGPWGVAAAAAAAALGGMIVGIGKVAAAIPALNDAVMGIGSSEEVTRRNLDNLRKTMADDDQRSLGEVTDLDRARGIVSGERARFTGSDIPGGPSFGYGPPPMGGAPPPSTGGVLGLSEARAEIKAAKDAARKGRHHKATKMDRNLAALDPSLAHVLRRGGDLDAGGDLKVHDDPLSRAVYAKATGSGAGGGSASLGPGPSIQNIDNRIMVSIQQAIDARGSGSPADNLRSAGSDVASQTGQEVVRITGARRAAAMRNAGGRMV